MRYPRFNFPATHPLRALIMTIAGRCGYAVTNITDTAFDVECPGADAVYRFGVICGEAVYRRAKHDGSLPCD